MDDPNSEPDKQPPIPVLPVPALRAPNELDIPDELAWQRYRTIATPKKHVVRLAPKVVSWRATRMLSVGNLLTAGILYMIAGLLYSGSPFRSTGERQYLSNAINKHKAVEKFAQALDGFKRAEAESYCRLVQKCLGVPLMQINAEEMNDSVFTRLQGIIHPLSIPVYDACLAFKRGSYLLISRSKPKQAVSFFHEFLNLVKTDPDSSPILPEQQRRLDVDRSQETVRHVNIAEDFIFDYARAVKQFIRPKFFTWWLCLASQALVHYELKTKRNCPSSELTQYLRNVHHLVELLDNSISKLLKGQSLFETVEHMQQLRETLLLEFHFEAATALADAANLLFLCKKDNESQEMIINSLNFLKRGVECAQDLNTSDWNTRFRIAQAILQIRLGNLKDAEELLHVCSKTIRNHTTIEDMKKLISEIKTKGKPKRSTKKRVSRSIAQTLIIQPIDWHAYDWSMFLGD